MKPSPMRYSKSIDVEGSLRATIKDRDREIEELRELLDDAQFGLDQAVGAFTKNWCVNWDALDRLSKDIGRKLRGE